LAADQNPVRLRIDALLLIVAVVLAIAVVPGQGIWGYAIGFVAVALLGAAVGLLGRKYPQIYGQRPAGEPRTNSPRWPEPAFVSPNAG
jgi:hypothetical protein